MTPQLREFAEVFAEQFIDALDDMPKKPDFISLALYESQIDYETLRPEDQPARFEDHAEMIQHVKTLIEWEFPDGPEVLTPVINASQYLRWLASEGRSNNAGARAEFIAIPRQP